MEVSCISIWGDSIGKGVVYDEARGRYMILKESFVNRLTKELQFPVENHAFMGCTAPQGDEKMMPEELHAGGIAAIEFGGNDCDMPWAEISQNPAGEYQPKTPLAEFRTALKHLVTRVRAGGMMPVLLTPPPLDAERYFQWVSRNLDPTAILKYLGDIQFIYRWQERYAGAVRDVASATGCMLMDLRDAFLAQRKVSDFLCVDGIHPNLRGHALIGDAIIERLK